MEHKDYLTTQILTYLGNKRKLLPYIEDVIQSIQWDLGKEHLSILDVFSGSGIVARLLKQYSDIIHVNDIEHYSYVLNSCYLMNENELDKEKLQSYIDHLNSTELALKEGFITRLYSPVDENDIQLGERVFFTKRNAMFIDTVRRELDKIEEPYKPILLALLLQKVSVHSNTAGIFKAFYKDKYTGIGKYGGANEDALSRIKADIYLEYPVLSKYTRPYKVYEEDANELVRKIHGLDVVYVDPPYNQHPYGSNYFMLNLVATYQEPTDISPVSGIPTDWNRSNYNKRRRIKDTFKDLIEHIDAPYIIVSYNSEGYLSKDDICSILTSFGIVTTKEIEYNTFRGSRNLKNRDIHVKEYLFVLKRR